MTLVILTGEIDISVGSVFAICGVVAGLLAKAGLPMPLVALAACLRRRRARRRSTARSSRTSGIPSIVVTLATMVALRDGLRWATEGAWVQDLPRGFQWLGLTQAAYPFVALGAAAVADRRASPGACAISRPAAPSTRPARTAEAARLAGLDTARRDVRRLRARRRADRARRACSTRSASIRFPATPASASR